MARRISRPDEPGRQLHVGSAMPTMREKGDSVKTSVYSLKGMAIAVLIITAWIFRTHLLILSAAIVVLVLAGTYWVLSIGSVRISDNEVGVVTKRFGKPLPAGRRIAFKGEIGVQAGILSPGLHWYPPFFYSIARGPAVHLDEGQIGIVEAMDGSAQPASHTFGKVVPCNDFQDAEAFFANGGQRGKQAAIVTTGTYHINPEAFKVEIATVTRIRPNEIGLVESKDGKPLPPGRSFAAFVSCEHFQDPGAFFANGGEQGKQLAILNTGSYQINTVLFFVKVRPVVTISPSEVGLVEAKDGADLLPGHTFGMVVSCNNFQDAQAFISGRGQRGKQAAILKTGSYQINTELFSVTIQPVVTIRAGEIGLIEALDGADLPFGRNFGRAVSCNNFQDAHSFFTNGGQRGKQSAVLTNGTYQINTALFKITITPEVRISATKIGLVDAKDGAPLRQGQQFGGVVDCDSFRDPEAFFQNGGQMGPQLSILRAGVYRIHPDLFVVRERSAVVIPQNEIGLVVAQAGLSVPPGRRLAKVVPCDNFQDAQAFLNNGGQRGQQLAILTPGTYEINTELFTVITSANAAEHGLNNAALKPFTLGSGKVGIVTAFDGNPVPQGNIAAPAVTGHNKFQDAQAFIDAGGCSGLQEEVLGEGSWNLNPWFVQVEEVPMTWIPSGAVGVVISNIGRVPDTHHELVDSGCKGIWKTALDAGTYSINSRVMDVVVVPTHEITLDWSEKEKPKSNYDANLHALELRSIDAFSFKLEVTQVIRIAPENAPKMISRVVSEGMKAPDVKTDDEGFLVTEAKEKKYGSVRNLVTRVLEPMVGNYFRNSAQEHEALSFLKRRGELQEGAGINIREALARYGVEAIGTFINDIDLPNELEEELKKPKIAQVQSEAFRAELSAERDRGELVRERGRIEHEAAKIKAESDKEIAEHEAAAEVSRATAKVCLEQMQLDIDMARKRQEAEIQSRLAQVKTDSLISEISALGPENYADLKKGEAMARAVEKGKFVAPKIVMGSGAPAGDVLPGMNAASLFPSLIIAREVQEQFGLLGLKDTKSLSASSVSRQAPLLERAGLGGNLANPRSPIILLIETSQAMAGDRSRRLAEALEEFKKRAAADSETMACTDLIVVTFGATAEVFYPFGPVVNLPPLPVGTSRGASLGRGFSLALTHLENQKRVYKTNNQPSRIPWLFTLVASAPTDDWRGGADRVKQLVEANELNCFVTLVQGADAVTLREYTPRHFPVILDGLKFNEMFVWLADVVQRVAHSEVGGAVVLPPPESWSVPPDYR